MHRGWFSAGKAAPETHLSPAHPHAAVVSVPPQAPIGRAGSGKPQLQRALGLSQLHGSTKLRAHLHQPAAFCSAAEPRQARVPGDRAGLAQNLPAVSSGSGRCCLCPLHVGYLHTHPPKNEVSLTLYGSTTCLPNTFQVIFSAPRIWN